MPEDFYTATFYRYGTSLEGPLTERSLSSWDHQIAGRSSMQPLTIFCQSHRNTEVRQVAAVLNITLEYHTVRSVVRSVVF